VNTETGSSTSPPHYPEGVRLDFKFTESVPPGRRLKVIEHVKQLGATHVAPQFPGESDPELASMYKVEGLPDERTGEVVSELDGLDEIEYAAPTPQRKLIR
jgi:hypothetical protein